MIDRLTAEIGRERTRGRVMMETERRKETEKERETGEKTDDERVKRAKCWNFWVVCMCHEREKEAIKGPRN